MFRGREMKLKYSIKVKTKKPICFNKILKTFNCEEVEIKVKQLKS